MSRPRGGFTLLELLAVMSIVALLSTLAATSYFQAIRGMARRNAYEHFLNALTLARQRACVDGSRVALIAFNQALEYDSSGKLSKYLPSYVVCKELGRVSFTSGNYLFDEFADLKELFEVEDSTQVSAKYKSGVRLYNLNKGYWTMVKPYVSWRQLGGSNQKLQISDDDHTFKSYAFEQISGSWAESTDAKTWEVGDAYGVEVTPVQNLPKTFYFDELPKSASDSAVLTKINYVTFNPDGTRHKTSGAGSTTVFTIKSDDAKAGSVKFTVNDEGKIL